MCFWEWHRWGFGCALFVFIPIIEKSIAQLWVVQVQFLFYVFKNGGKLVRCRSNKLSKFFQWFTYHIQRTLLQKFYKVCSGKCTILLALLLMIIQIILLNFKIWCVVNYHCICYRVKLLSYQFLFLLYALVAKLFCLYCWDFGTCTLRFNTRGVLERRQRSIVSWVASFLSSCLFQARLLLAVWLWWITRFSLSPCLIVRTGGDGPYPSIDQSCLVLWCLWSAGW